MALGDLLGHYRVSTEVGILAQFGVRKLAGDDQGGFWQQLQRVSFRGNLGCGLHLGGPGARPCTSLLGIGLHSFMIMRDLESPYFASLPHSTWALNVVFQSGCLSSTHPNCILSARHFPKVAYDTTGYIVRPELSYITSSICKELEEIQFLKVCSSHIQLKISVSISEKEKSTKYQGLTTKLSFFCVCRLWNQASPLFSVCCSVAKSCLTLCDPMDRSTLGFPVLHYLLEFAQTHIHWVSDAIQPFILCHPLFLLPSIFPSFRIFSSKLALRTRCPKYWSFSFSISPSSKYSGLISFRIDWLDLLAVQGTLKSYSPFNCKIFCVSKWAV